MSNQESDQNKPNQYLVTYQVMEGNNYAGGWVERTKYIKDLSKLTSFTRNDILSVQPVYVEIFDALNDNTINAAINEAKKEEEKEKAEREVERAERRLKQAQDRLNNQ